MWKDEGRCVEDVLEMVERVFEKEELVFLW